MNSITQKYPKNLGYISTGTQLMIHKHGKYSCQNTLVIHKNDHNKQMASRKGK
jgi:hypothetical protein